MLYVFQMCSYGMPLQWTQDQDREWLYGLWVTKKTNQISFSLLSQKIIRNAQFGLLRLDKHSELLPHSSELHSCPKKTNSLLRLLIRNRLQVGVSTDNTYIFALNNYSSSSHIQGSNCLRKFSVVCGATHPGTLWLTSFPKHVAIMSQILSLKENE